MITERVQGVGHSPDFQMVLQIEVSAVIMASPPAWISSAGILSGPADLPGFSDLTAFSTSSLRSLRLLTGSDCQQCKIFHYWQAVPVNNGKNVLLTGTPVNSEKFSTIDSKMFHYLQAVPVNSTVVSIVDRHCLSIVEIVALLTGTACQ